MRKYRKSFLLFYIVTFAIFSCAILLVGCINSSSSENGGNFEFSEDQPLEDDEISTQSIDFSVQVSIYTSSGIITYQEVAEKEDYSRNYFNIYWCEGDNGSQHGIAKSWGNIPAYTNSYGHSNVVKENNTNAHYLTYFSYSWWFGVQRFAMLEINNSNDDYQLWIVNNSSSFEDTTDNLGTSSAIYRYIYMEMEKLLIIFPILQLEQICLVIGILNIVKI